MELISVLSGNKMLLVFYHIFLFHGIMWLILDELICVLKYTLKS